jgi:SAM-dependent methyltransferase
VSTLLEFVRRPAPEPWVAAPGIPWSDPGFSERMLREHLSQDHDRASRREAIVDAHVVWMHETLLDGNASRVLDLGCGPGLYTSRLARLGHKCVGIDFSPASIAHAERTAREAELSCTYRCEDLHTADFDQDYDLVMLIFGELNAFAPDDARALLANAHRALRADGVLLLEVHTADSVRSAGTRPPFWYSAEQGLFSDRPHVLLQEHAWLQDASATVIRYSVVDAEQADVHTFVEGRQAYTDDGYRALLTAAGFEEVQLLPRLPGTADAPNNLTALVARKLV